MKFSDLLESLKTDTQHGDATNKSWNWYLSKAKENRAAASQATVNSLQAINDNKVDKFKGKIFPKSIAGNQTMIGRMILFQYDPKLKDKLPYWDQFPLGFVIEVFNNGYLMLNMHYLPLPQRAKLMDDLMRLAINNKDIDKVRLQATYKYLKTMSFRNWKPTIHRYLYSNVKSKWSMISADEWNIALMLPLQRFYKASASTVWSDSLKKGNK
jgi:hypothetical protein